MKTGAYWFKFLTDKEQQEFKVNCGENFKMLMNVELSSLRRFLSCCFNWSKTPQGHNYWHEISQRKVE